MPKRIIKKADEKTKRDNPANVRVQAGAVVDNQRRTRATIDEAFDEGKKKKR
jgi:hypothetical protein